MTEIDETYIGGKSEHGKYRQKMTAVFGMVERGGSVMTRVVDNVKNATLFPLIETSVDKSARISTDQATHYRGLPKIGYQHASVNHAASEWVRGDTHTQSIESFWGRLKLSIRGTHVHVSRKHLPKYLGEFEYRFNMRNNPEAMFARLLLSF